MCYSFEHSLVSFLSVTVCGSVALALPVKGNPSWAIHQPILGCLMLCYGLMQLSEMLIWRGIDSNNDSLNRAGTAVGKYTLCAHNVALGVGVLIAYWSKSDSELPLGKRYMIWAPLAAGILFYIGVMINYALVPDSSDITPACTYDEDKEKNSCTKNSARLQWPFPHTYYFVSYAISVAIMIAYVRPLWPNGTLIAFFYTFSFIVTLSLGKSQVQGSYWCWAAAMFAPLLLIANTVLGHRATNFIS